MEGRQRNFIFDVGNDNKCFTEESKALKMFSGVGKDFIHK